MADPVVLLVICVIALWLAALVRPFHKRRAEARFRAASLRFDDQSGLYRWQTLDGRAHQSDKHPAEPGGAWYEAEAEGVKGLNP